MNELLTICSSEPHLTEVTTALDQAGIKYRVERDESTVSGLTHGGSTASLSVYVSADDYPKALGIVKAIDKKAEESLPWCPKCGSENVERHDVRLKRGPWWMLVIGILMIVAGIFVPMAFFTWVAIIGGIGLLITFFKGFTETRYHCRDCGNDFKRT